MHIESHIDPACYLMALGNLKPSKNKVEDLEEFLQDEYEYYDDKILVFSVTSREKNYEEWVNMARTYPGGTVTTTERKLYNGRKYTVYYCTLPLTPQL